MYKPSVEEMAEDLPPATANWKSLKAQTLLVAEILKLFTDSEHGLTADTIREVIGAKTGKVPTAAKVRDDIHALADANAFGMDISIPSRGESMGFRCMRTFLSSEQARLAINMVRTCKFVTKRQRDEICEALLGMVSYYQQDDIARSVVVDERELPQNPSVNVFAAAEAFSAAIEKRRRVTFRYVARGLDGSDLYSKDLRTGDELFDETPIALVYSFGNYYAETWSGDAEQGKRLMRRLDRIRDARISDSPAVSSRAIDELRRTVQERIGQMFDMYGEGDTRDLFLKVDAHAARYVYDRFGHGVKFEHIEHDGSFGYVHVRVRPAQTFYRWLFGMGDQITIARPMGPLWEGAFRKHGLDQSKTHEALLEDYEVAISGMRKLVAQALEVYGHAVEG